MANKEIAKKDIFQRNDIDFMSTELDGEVVIMNTNNGRYLGFNEVTSEVWKLLENPVSFQKIIEHLMESFNVSAKECETDISDLLSRMLKIKLAKKVDA